MSVFTTQELEQIRRVRAAREYREAAERRRIYIRDQTRTLQVILAIWIAAFAFSVGTLVVMLMLAKKSYQPENEAPYREEQGQDANDEDPDGDPALFDSVPVVGLGQIVFPVACIHARIRDLSVELPVGELSWQPNVCPLVAHRLNRAGVAP